MKVNIAQGKPIYCDMGPHNGQYRIDVRGSIYLAREELPKWQTGEMSLGVLFIPGDTENDTGNG